MSSKLFSRLGLFALLAVFVVSSSACRADDDDGPADSTVELRKDGNNVTGPILGFGYHEFAVRFTRDDVQDLVGGSLERVQFFVGRIPAQLEVVVYGAGTATTPGPVRYEADITSRITTTGFREFTLPTPLPIFDEDIWISIGVLLNESAQSIGCDAGPAQLGGDMIFRSTDQDWGTFEQRTGESINWNIRGIVSRPQ